MYLYSDFCNEIVAKWLRKLICHILFVTSSEIYHFVLYMACGDNFDKKSQIKKKRFFFLHSIFSCYYCSRDLKRLSKHSGLCPDMSSLVVIKLGLMVVIFELKYLEKKVHCAEHKNQLIKQLFESFFKKPYEKKIFFQQLAANIDARIDFCMRFLEK